MDRMENDRIVKRFYLFRGVCWQSLNESAAYEDGVVISFKEERMIRHIKEKKECKWSINEKEKV